MSDLPPPPPSKERLSLIRLFALGVLAIALCGAVGTAAFILGSNRGDSSNETITGGAPQQAVTEQESKSSAPLLPTAPDNERLNGDLSDFLVIADETKQHLQIEINGQRDFLALQFLWDDVNRPGIDTERSLVAALASLSLKGFEVDDWAINSARNDLIRFSPVSEGVEPLLEIRDQFITYVDAWLAGIEAHNEALAAMKRDWQNPDDGSKAFSYYIERYADGPSAEFDRVSQELCDNMLLLESSFEVEIYNARKIETYCTSDTYPDF